MAKIIQGNPTILGKVVELERDFKVKVSHKTGSDTAYLIKGKNTDSFLTAILGIEGVREIENNY